MQHPHPHLPPIPNPHPTYVCSPRMFAFTLHLKSATAHAGVKHSMLRPTLSYIFEADKYTSSHRKKMKKRKKQKIAPAPDAKTIDSMLSHAVAAPTHITIGGNKSHGHVCKH